MNSLKNNFEEQNHEFDLAEQFALQTNHHFFLTGKAGSGKTTLLRKIAHATNKNYVIVAPTGVAAINAGGVTMHSMFNLPLTSFIPSNDYVDLNFFTNHSGLLNHMKFRREKINVLNEMELLIIDEISMVRADVLDAVDFILRKVRHHNQPFGGVQIMLIGDMHQLPPVVKDYEWNVLKKYYNSPYFFDSKVWNQIEAVEIELKKIYRQTEAQFLNLLNNIRHQQMDEGDYELLKSRYKPTFKPTEPGYILLTTHNSRASSINESELNKLSSASHFFEAEIDGDFPENIYPCEKHLELKVGAQVMFTRNDSGQTREYYNGKIATVTDISDGDITVTFSDSHRDFLMKRETWENINYTLEQGTNKIKSNLLGTFSQFPLRLAWAITIHKSQGLTFEKVIIDAGSSFASGQVYVALSRCTSLQGIVLHSLITQSALYGDNRITEFSNAHHSENELKQTLEVAKVTYANYQLKRLFDFEKLRNKMDEWKEMILEKNIPDKINAIELHGVIADQIESLITTSQKFQRQLEQLLIEYKNDSSKLPQIKERCTKAIEYFNENIFMNLINPLHEHIKENAYKSKVKRYVQQIQFLQDNFWTKISQLYQAKFLDEKIFTGEVKYSKSLLQNVESSVTTTKKEKGGTYKDTLDLYNQGKTIDEIAAMRGLVSSTIKSHFAKWITTGEIDLNKVFKSTDIERIEKFLAEHPNDTYSAVKTTFGDEFDYNDIRMVINYAARKNKLQQ